MLKTLFTIFETGNIDSDSNGGTVKIQSHTPMEQGVFIQELYDKIQPRRSLEVGFAYGISTMFILEKCRQYERNAMCHIVIEPHSWGPAALYNIQKEGLEKYLDIRSDLSDKILPEMHLKNERIQFAYVDTTKIFDTVLQDFYFIDKILDVGGVVILDDANSSGINMVTRFIATLPHYKIIGRFDKESRSKKYKIGQKILEIFLSFVPFKKRLMNFYSFNTSRQLGLDYRCIAFKKMATDTRAWHWEMPF